MAVRLLNNGYLEITNENGEVVAWMHPQDWEDLGLVKSTVKYVWERD